jgi:hypothetical protein
MDGSVKRVSCEAINQRETAAHKPDSNPTTAETLNARGKSDLLANLNSALQPDQPVEKVSEIEPNNAPRMAMEVRFPAEIKGCIEQSGDVDHFSFESEKGQSWFFDVIASRSGSKLDSKLEVLSSDGHPMERAVLQSVRSSWLTFRGKDSNTSDDFRIQHFREMEINEFLYCNGEIVKIWMYPRGPDSGGSCDPASTARIEDLIFELKENYTIIIVTHNMQQAARVSDQTAFFFEGKLVESGPTQQLYTRPSIKQTEDYITGRFG